MTCAACNERPAEHGTGECHRCYQRRWRETNPQHNRRVGKRAEQKRAWDRRKAESLSASADKTPGNQSGPASGATDRDRGNQERGS